MFEKTWCLQNIFSDYIVGSCLIFTSRLILAAVVITTFEYLHYMVTKFATVIDKKVNTVIKFHVKFMSGSTKLNLFKRIREYKMVGNHCCYCKK